MDGLRERRIHNTNSHQTPPILKNRFKKLDFFPKVNDEYVIQTKQGGYGNPSLWLCNVVVTVITSVIMAVLILSEFIAFIHPKRSDIITVRNSNEERMFINFNMTLYNITCGKVVINILDEDGMHPYGSSSHLSMLDLDINGKPIGFSRLPAKGARSCGSCFGAGIQGQCCSSCEDVLSAFQDRGWNTGLVKQYARICNPHLNLTHVRHVGCMLWGTIDANHEAGSIHLSARTGQVDRYGYQIYDTEIIKQYNSSHLIHHLTFGNLIPGMTNPLKNHQFLTDYLTSHEYSIEVLPAEYQSKRTVEHSNEIAVCETDTVVSVGLNGYADHQPGIFFHYSISPFMHVIRMEKESFSFFLIRLCAVLGGTMAVSRMVDHLFYYLKRLYVCFQ